MGQLEVALEELRKFKVALQEAIDIAPDWIKKDRILILLANQELIAQYDDNDGLKVKSQSCNQCGECCLDVPQQVVPFPVEGAEIGGKCSKLNDDGSCGAGAQKPFACLRDPNKHDIKDLDCSIRYI